MEVRDRPPTLSMVSDGREGITAGLVMEARINGSVIATGNRVFTGMEPAVFDFVVAPAVTMTGSVHVVRVICTPKGQARNTTDPSGYPGCGGRFAGPACGLPTRRAVATAGPGWYLRPVRRTGCRHCCAPDQGVVACGTGASVSGFRSGS